jgi:hypothetical protein
MIDEYTRWDGVRLPRVDPLDYYEERLFRVERQEFERFVYAALGDEDGLAVHEELQRLVGDTLPRLLEVDFREIDDYPDFRATCEAFKKLKAAGRIPEHSVVWHIEEGV